MTTSRCADARIIGRVRPATPRPRRPGQRGGRSLVGDVAACVLVPTAIVACAALPSLVPSDPVPPAEASAVRVRAGDSLWYIASEHTPRGASVADTLETVRRMNGLPSASVAEGDVILVPRVEDDRRVVQR